MGYRLFSPDAASKAWMEDCSRKSETDCAVHLAGTIFFVGDDLGNRQYRSFVSFNTAGLPDDAILTNVKLRIKSAGILGTDPVNKRRDLVVDICTPPMSKTVSHSIVTVQKPITCEMNLGAFEHTSNNGWYTVDLLPSALSSVNIKGITQFRLRISGASRDAGRAYIQFYSAEADESNSPILLVKYRMP